MQVQGGAEGGVQFDVEVVEKRLAGRDVGGVVRAGEGSSFVEGLICEWRWR